MRSLTTSELIMVNGGVALSEQFGYKLANDVYKTLLPSIAKIPLIGGVITSFISQDKVLSDNSTMPLGVYLLGNFLETVTPNFLKDYLSDNWIGK